MEQRIIHFSKTVNFFRPPPLLKMFIKRTLRTTGQVFDKLEKEVKEIRVYTGECNTNNEFFRWIGKTGRDYIKFIACTLKSLKKKELIVERNIKREIYPWNWTGSDRVISNFVSLYIHQFWLISVFADSWRITSDQPSLGTPRMLGTPGVVFIKAPRSSYTQIGLGSS